MKAFEEYTAGIENLEHRSKADEIYSWIANRFPHLEQQMKWNTPMFTDHGTFIIGIDKAKHHMSFAPEEAAMKHFAQLIEEAGYSSTKWLFRIKWNQPVDYELLEKIIKFNIQEKADCATFWR
ncbi:iron chaperone [Jeotgalibacillus sp. ET6]|uniref:iron chaperone n=1 Tax=Jeotgalibacillus sp. ET6 TaxID=3037260 RepID=UPI00241873E8|nr:iron chaperone [Jeotgalibacillus sp. ET6]MDG5473538.1 iron chaperone [Jeotgalibacillus sp. ET6]